MVTCNYCGREAQLVSSAVVYGGRDYGPVWHCAPCRAWVGCHPGTTDPLGRLANEELRHWKKKGHEVFDPIWKMLMRYGWKKSSARQRAYECLAREMRLLPQDCHFGMFTVEQCKRAIALCRSGRVGPGTPKREPRAQGILRQLKEL